MSARLKLFILVVACQSLFLAPLVSAQGAVRVLRVVDFSGDGLLPSEATALQGLVTSYVIELNQFKVIDAQGQELALREAETAVQLGGGKEVDPLVADFILSGRADKAGSLIVFTMDVTKVSSGEKKGVADGFASVNDLILASRRLTRGLFESQELPAAKAAEPLASNPSPSLAMIAGSWKGDKNIDRVTLFPDGRGFAILASGVRMSLKATIDGSTVLISQNQPNSPDFYRPSLDIKTARLVAKDARAWRWVFALSSDKGSLVGVKESVFVTIDKGVLSLDNNYVRSAQWERLYR
jgi:hypothetical protein